MTSTANFEAAHLADAVNKAARIAPTKGSSFDKAAGILFEVHPDHAVIMATNLETSYRQVIHGVTTSGITSPLSWRMPSRILSSFLAALPMGGNSSVSFIQKDPEEPAIRIKSGTTVAKVSLFAADDFPRIRTFDPDGMVEANDLAARLASVSWATDRKAQNIKAGVHIDGTNLVATDGYKLAIYPCEVPVVEPITVAAHAIAPLLKQATDVRIKANGLDFQMMLDPETQAITTIFEAKYPKYMSFVRDDFTGVVNVNRNYMLEVLQRMMTVIEADKSPHLVIEAKAAEGRLVMDMEAPSGERIRDEVSFSGECVDTVLGASPGYIIQALQGSKRDSIKFSFGHPDPARLPMSTLRISDDTGYDVHIMQKVKSTPAPDNEE